MTNNKSTNQSTIISQLDKANTVLKALSGNTTSNDRRTAEEELNYSRYTIGTYLKGEGKDLDVAMALIDFFQNRIEDRNRKLNGADQQSQNKKIV